ncbi:hypothetical protein [uncultured Pseudoteredinibacter sp.]|uniref:hypothetical protein n=1 Tax=uncultured Pseudoteredinibacter sp. TaxID=1641701 RepID=UPI0026192530|nr:hypothetical protein [uncultured Pseudoteredinibacter sp.]
MDVNEYINEQIENNSFTPADKIGNVIHYTWCEHGEAAVVLEQAAGGLSEALANMYPGFTIEMKNYSAPNNEHNVQISIRRENS